MHTWAENKSLYMQSTDALKLTLVCNWAKVDSNHRRQCQQIYSLSPLATRERSHMFEMYSAALPPNITGAGERSRTINLLITNQLLCH